MYKIKSGQVLLLGEGDFSFTVAFQPLCGIGVNITATSYLGDVEVKQLHQNAAKNINMLKGKGVEVCHSVDATKLHESILRERKFERIIFNFPHIGGKSNIKKNRELLMNFFPSAVQVLGTYGDVCVTLAQGQAGTPLDAKQREWHDSWQVVGAAAYSDMVLTDVLPFTIDEYPEYSSTGFRSRDQHFYTKGGMTYIFRRSPEVLCPRAEPQYIGPVPVNVDGQQVKVNKYISNKINRNLLEIDQHPLSLCYKHFIEEFKVNQSRFSKRFDNCVEIPTNKLVESLQQGELAYAVEALETPKRCDTGTLGSVKHLRKSMIESIADFADHNDNINEGIFYIACGSVYRKVGVDNRDLPVQHELCIFNVESDSVCLENFKDIIMSTCKNILPNTKQGCGNKGKHANVLMDSSVINISFTTENSYFQNACNQVEAKGPPELRKNLNKNLSETKQVGYIGKFDVCQYKSELNCHAQKKLKLNLCDKPLLCCVLNLDYITQIRYDIPDQRIFWSTNESFLSQFSKGYGDRVVYKPLSMFPPLWRHDISFWEKSENDNLSEVNDKEFDEQRLCDIIRDVTGDSLSCILLMNVWAEPQNGRVSRCYRQVYQSPDIAISHTRAHSFQNAVRLTVAAEMGVELR